MEGRRRKTQQQQQQQHRTRIVLERGSLAERTLCERHAHHKVPQDLMPVDLQTDGRVALLGLHVRLGEHHQVREEEHVEAIGARLQVALCDKVAVRRHERLARRLSTDALVDLDDALLLVVHALLLVDLRVDVANELLGALDVVVVWVLADRVLEQIRQEELVTGRPLNRHNKV